VVTAAALGLGAAAVAIGALLLRAQDDEASPLRLQTSPPAAGSAARPSVAESTVRGYDDSRSFLARTPEDSQRVNKYARAAADDIDWGQGTDVWYGGAFYLAKGFYDAQQGEIDLLRWDNFEVDRSSTDRGGVVLYGGDETGNAYLMRARLGGEQDELIGPFRLAEEEWHWIEVHQRFSAGSTDDLSELFVDGERIGRTKQPNWYGRPITAIRFGLVATGGARQERPLSLWFDRPSISDRMLGPAG
jgi:hypothetical protein